MSLVKQISENLYLKINESMKILNSSQLQPRQPLTGWCMLTHLWFSALPTSSTRLFKSQNKNVEHFPTHTHKMPCLQPCLVMANEPKDKVGENNKSYRFIHGKGALPNKLGYRFCGSRSSHWYLQDQLLWHCYLFFF